MAPLVRPVWCSCGVDGEHLDGFGESCVRASTLTRGAVVSPLVSSPAAPAVASSHRTVRTSDRRSFPIATPLGTTTRFAIR